VTTTLTPRSGTAAPAKTPGGLPWTVLRLHRWALGVWTAYVVLAVGSLLWAWRLAAGDRTRSLLADCQDTGGPYPACPEELSEVWSDYDLFLRVGLYALLLAPFLVATWAAASLTAREMETGTAELAWTQSVTPTRWLTAKLALPAAAAACGTALLIPLHRLAHLAGDDLRERAAHWPTPEWWGEEYFAGLGIVTVPRVLCAVAVGVLLGLLLRRTLASLGVGLLLTAAGTVKAVIGRELLWPAEIHHGSDSLRFWLEGSPVDEWHVDSGAVNEAGDRVDFNEYQCFDTATVGEGTVPDTPDPDGIRACLEAEGFTDVWTTYHPKAHFWPLQLVESGIWLAVAALAVFLSYRLLRRRTASGERAA
jgi:hypothetical protein